MKNCELCKSQARAFCEADRAILCWDCDAKVHAANFLVARHSRVLLCLACQSPTSWKASGPKLHHAFCLCDRCAVNNNNSRELGEEVESELACDDDDSEISGDDDDDADEEEEDGENQVVPLTRTPPPPATSSSSSEESVRRVYGKRMRDDVPDLPVQDDLHCSSSDGEAGVASARRHSKERKVEPESPVQNNLVICNGEDNTRAFDFDLNF